MNSRNKIPVSILLGGERYSEEPEQIIMKNYNLNVDTEDEIIIGRHSSVSKIIEDFSESSSIDNGSLSEMNCISCYIDGGDDKHYVPHSQKYQYYYPPNAGGKEEYTRIFDYNLQYQYSSFAQQPSYEYTNFPQPQQQSHHFFNNKIQHNHHSHHHSNNILDTSSPTATPLAYSSVAEDNESICTNTSTATNTTINTNNDSPFLLKNVKGDVSTPSQFLLRPKSSTKLNKIVKETTRQMNKTILCITQENNENSDEVINIKSMKRNSFQDATLIKKVTNEFDIKPTRYAKSLIVPSKKKNSSMELHASPQKHRPSVSKYDFVKVRVYLSGEHYYVLSRFLISRMLTATRVNYVHAVRIALNLKKRLVDRNDLDITQKKMEKDLFELMKEFGYNEKNIVLYKLISGFHHERIPLIILLGGPRCVGKSTLATQLAERLNLPNVIKTDTVYDLMCSILSIPEKDRESIWFRNCSNEELIYHYNHECKLVKQGLEADLKKCFTEGKSIIIEGTHITHELYDFILECTTKYSPQKTDENQSLNSTFSSKLSTINHKPCSGVVIPFYLDMDDKNSHREYLYDRMITEYLINNQNNSICNPVGIFSQNQNIGNNQIYEFESRIDLINDIFIKENIKRKDMKTLSDEPKSFKNINVDSKLFYSTLNKMHSEVLNKLQEIFSVSG